MKFVGIAASPRTRRGAKPVTLRALGAIGVLEDGRQRLTAVRVHDLAVVGVVDHAAPFCQVALAHGFDQLLLVHPSFFLLSPRRVLVCYLSQGFA